MGVLRSWLLGVTGGAMLVALAHALLPDGVIGKVGRFTGGLVLFVAVLQPIAGMDYDTLARGLSVARMDLGEYTALPTTKNFDLMKSIIEERSAAYIVDKAAGRGITCTVRVTCSADEREAYPYPVSVEVTGTLSPTQREELTRLIEGELAVPAEEQSYTEEIREGDGSG